MLAESWALNFQAEVCLRIPGKVHVASRESAFEVRHIGAGHETFIAGRANLASITRARRGTRLRPEAGRVSQCPFRVNRVDFGICATCPLSGVISEGSGRRAGAKHHHSGHAAGGRIRFAVPSAARAKRNLPNGFNLIWVVQPPSQIYFVSHSPQISGSYRAVSSRQEGRIAIVTNARRDAVDATASARKMIAGRDRTRERFIACKTNDAGAYGKTVWSRHPLLVPS